MAQPATERHASPRFRPDRSGIPSVPSEFSLRLRSLTDVLDSLIATSAPCYTETDAEIHLYPEHEVVTQLDSLPESLQGLVNATDGKASDGRDVAVMYQLTRFGSITERRYTEKHRFGMTWAPDHPADIAGIILQPSAQVLRSHQRSSSEHPVGMGKLLLQRLELQDRQGRYVSPYQQTGDEARDQARWRAYHNLHLLRVQAPEVHVQLFQDLLNVLTRQR
jgi:hypothetical protein